MDGINDILSSLSDEDIEKSGVVTDGRAASLRLAIPHLVNKIREGVSRRFTVYRFVWKKPSEDAGT